MFAVQAECEPIKMEAGRTIGWPGATSPTADLHVDIFVILQLIIKMRSFRFRIFRHSRGRASRHLLPEQNSEEL